jgi:hypothetical protein
LRALGDTADLGMIDMAQVDRVQVHQVCFEQGRAERQHRLVQLARQRRPREKSVRASCW